MPRGTGRKGKIETELGVVTYTKDALSSVTTPASKVNKKFVSSAERFSGLEDYEPVVYLDGVISGCNVTPGTAADSFDVSAGTYQIKGNSYTLAASTGETGLTRPTVDGNIVVNAISLDTSGNINVTAGTEGTTSTTRGAAGGPPYIPVDQVLIGYITLGYTSATAGAVITSSEIDDSNKEYSYLPGYKVIYHDDGGENKGCIEFDTALGAIHTGDTTRNVYVTYYAPDSYVELSDSKDYTLTGDQATVKSQAYDDTTEQTHTTIKSWSGSFDYYDTKVKSTMISELDTNRRRWFKFYPDRDSNEHFTGIAVISSIGSGAPVGDMTGGTISLEGDGELYRKSS
jgi:hypothetical protein